MTTTQHKKIEEALAKAEVDIKYAINDKRIENIFKVLRKIILECIVEYDKRHN
jgi:hypothetical protein